MPFSEVRFFLTTSGREKIDAFLSPQSAVYTTWNDTYNGILIQELLSRTPLTHGLELSPEEMMDYGTGAWYFASRDPRQIGIDATDIHTDKQHQEFQDKVEAIENQGGNPRYIHYQADDVTLWDILPQHYHNNYLIAVCIFLFGWLPGLALIGALGLFYWILFFMYYTDTWESGFISCFLLWSMLAMAGSILPVGKFRSSICSLSQSSFDFRGTVKYHL